MPAKKSKILVLGFDGASPKLIDQWIEDLPTFKRLKTHGIFGHTIPPIPAQTPVAWTTFMTGKNPGKHGIFSFMMRKKGSYRRQIAQPSMTNSKTIWHLLSEGGKKIGVINVPMSDAEQIKGFIIPGFLSPTEGTPHPEKIKNIISRKFGIESLTGDVETEILRNVDKAPEKFFKRTNEITEETAQISQFLAQKEDWDFFMTVFMSTDRIQHFFWNYVDSTHEQHEKNKFTQLVKDHYVKLDGIMKDFLELIDKETIVIVLSDHGFCQVSKELVINNYLEELGFLKAKNDRVDLERSEAVSYGYGDIWLNVKNREPQGLIKLGKEYEKTRNAIIQALKNLRMDGEKPFKDIKKREEIYWGEQLSNGPDLMAIFNTGWQAARRPEIMEKQPSGTYVNEKPRWSGGHDGTHDPVDVPGIIGIIGPNTQKPLKIQVHLWDLAPTILQIMNMPIPHDMDGQPIQL